MDRDRFAGFARWLAMPGSRRGVLATALGGILAEVAETEAKHHKGKGKRKKGKHKKAACLRGGKAWCGGRCRAPRWTPRTTFGGPGDGDDQFSVPFAVAVAENGQTVWVADAHHRRISVWRKVGSTWTHAGNFGSEGGGDNQFSDPRGVAVADDGQTAWVADGGNSRISVWTKTGSTWTHQTNFGDYGSGDSQLKFPGGVAVTESGQTVLVADSGNNRISVWAKSGSTWTHAANYGSGGDGDDQFSSPRGLAVAENGQTVWVADADHHRISVWRKSGSTWTHARNFGSFGSGDRQFFYPYGVAVVGNGQTVWVAEQGNDRISVWSEVGSTWTHQTNFGASGSGDSQFYNPTDATAANDGRTVWVADEGNSRISVWRLGCPNK